MSAVCCQIGCISIIPGNGAVIPVGVAIPGAVPSVHARGGEGLRGVASMHALVKAPCAWVWAAIDLHSRRVATKRTQTGDEKSRLRHSSKRQKARVLFASCTAASLPLSLFYSFSLSLSPRRERNFAELPRTHGYAEASCVSICGAGSPSELARVVVCGETWVHL